MNNIDKLKISPNASIREALSLLEHSGASILLLLKENGALERTITDGDLRRLLLLGKGLDDHISCLDTQSPVVVYHELTNDKLLEIMDKHAVNQLPLLNEDGRPLKVYLRKELQAKIQLSTPHIGKYEKHFINEAFESNWVAPVGPNIDEFEKEIANYVGAKYAVALSSGTAAIHLALILSGVKSGDFVLCSSFTFVASANPILYQNATPIFVDSEPATWNMCPLALEKAIEDCYDKGVKPKAIVVVHLYGQSANMDKILYISKKYNIPLIEDAAESLGACYQGKHTGTLGEFGIFSFNGNKIITTSGGGMLICNNQDYADKARFLSTQSRDDAPYYQHSCIGYNYRMSNILAGIGRGQLKVLNHRVASRRQIFEKYRDALNSVGCFNWMPEPEGDLSNRWLSVVSLNSKKTNITPKQIIEHLANLNIEARYTWRPMHRQPLFKECLYFQHKNQVSYCDYLFETSICLPSASNMTDKQQNTVINALLDMF